MERIEIKYMPVDELLPYANNPRKNDKAVEFVANSIREFGFKVPIVIDENREVIAGHTRLKASKELGLTEVPVIVASDLDEERIKAFRLADNKVGEMAEWDTELLEKELSFLQDMEQFGFLDTESDITLGNNPYTQKVDTPTYEPAGEEVSLTDLVDSTKTDELVTRIHRANLPRDIEEFLILGAQRHLEFNYKAIAEYYAQADKNVQELFEESALVIIDFDRAIELGYLNLTEKIQGLIGDE